MGRLDKLLLVAAEQGLEVDLSNPHIRPLLTQWFWQQANQLLDLQNWSEYEAVFLAFDEFSSRFPDDENIRKALVGSSSCRFPITPPELFETVLNVLVRLAVEDNFPSAASKARSLIMQRWASNSEPSSTDHGMLDALDAVLQKHPDYMDLV